MVLMCQSRKRKKNLLYVVNVHETTSTILQQSTHDNYLSGNDKATEKRTIYQKKNHNVIAYSTKIHYSTNKIYSVFLYFNENNNSQMGRVGGDSDYLEEKHN